jgi:hypothetical protein
MRRATENTLICDVFFMTSTKPLISIDISSYVPFRRNSKRRISDICFVCLLSSLIDSQVQICNSFSTTVQNAKLAFMLCSEQYQIDKRKFESNEDYFTPVLHFMYLLQFLNLFKMITVINCKRQLIKKGEFNISSL